MVRRAGPVFSLSPSALSLLYFQHDTSALSPGGWPFFPFPPFSLPLYHHLRTLPLAQPTPYVSPFLRHWRLLRFSASAPESLKELKINDAPRPAFLSLADNTSTRPFLPLVIVASCEPKLSSSATRLCDFDVDVFIWSAQFPMNIRTNS